MTHTRDRGRVALVIAVLGAPAGALAAPSAQGISPQGISPQGISPQGISPQGISPQGISPQGISPQGQQSSGVALIGGDLFAADLAGVEIGSVEMRGTTAGSAVQPFELSSGPGISTGSGDYISIGGDPAAGHYAVAHLVDATGNPAEDLDLYIADQRADPDPNLLHRGDEQGNDDVTLYTVLFFHRSGGQWASLCPYHAATGGATAMAIAEDPAQPNRFIFACTATGVAAKCARIWGFRPWRQDHAYVFDDASGDWVDRTFAMKPFYDACKIAARAAYCQDRQSFTRDGTLIDLFDTRQLVWPNAIERPFGDDPDSRWMFTQEYFVSVDPLASHPAMKASALERTRYRDLSPAGQCTDLAFVDRLEQDHFEDGRWSSPLTGTPRIEVFSPSYCAHNERETGAPLAWDCSPCTTAVCKHQPRCCHLDADGGAGWDALCVAEAEATCGDPPGRVWPRDRPAAPPARSKPLMSPGGAVERVDGPGGAGGRATLSGWACDPEWPGAAVTVAIYGGAPREQPGAALLGTAYADRALAAPLAGEVAAACDGGGRATARHGFSFTLPPGQNGDVFVYALDAATADGPAAPPTLLRNGIVDASGGGAGRGQRVAVITTGWLEAPASGTYTFAAAAEPSRLFVNGRKLADWWGGAGPTAGSIDLMAGGRYHIRWDRLDTPPPEQEPSSNVASGVTWQGPGDAAPAAIPPALLYRIAPGRGQGLAATYQGGDGGPTIQRVDPAVDLGSGAPATVSLPDGVAASRFSVVWQGEVVPLDSDTYTFTVTSAGAADLSIAGQSLLPPDVTAPPLAPSCAHDICALGDKLAASTSYTAACHPCVDEICAQDPFCCDGGYLSYYSSEPPWDAKCVAEVGAICGLSCKNPLPSRTTRQRAATPIALQAGVRYPIRLAVNSDTGDVTTQLSWSSARQLRQIVPTDALFPPAAAAGAGAGLNTVVFATADGSGASGPDLGAPLASGPTPDLSIGADARTAAVDVLADPSDPAAGAPPPPAVVSPWPGAHDVQPAPQVALTVIGGVAGGSLRVATDGTTQGASPSAVVLPFDAAGNITGALVPVGSYGPHTLTLVQRTYAGATCTSSPAAGVCADSAPLALDVVADAQTPPVPAPPVMTGPRDPTHSPEPAANVFRVSGHGAAGPVQACDQGGIGAAGVIAESLSAGGDGTISGSVTLTPGSPVTPNAGWHKLSLSQDQCATTSKPVFVSVGMRPPTVEFPRSGAPVDCSTGAAVTQLVARGSLPYAPDSFGPLVIGEELGRLPLGLVQALVNVDATARADGSFGFDAVIPLGLASGLPFGKHLLYFFQAPPAPPGATQAEIDAHLRAFASIAATPTSRIAIAVPPPPLGLPGAAVPLVVSAVAPVLAIAGCAQQLVPACAQPLADVNVRDGARVWTTRASDSGDWQIALPDLTPGWHALTLAQVVDSPAGGGWVESCPSPSLPVGVASPAGVAPALALPAHLVADATGPLGAVLAFTAGAIDATGAPLPVDCQPPSGTQFPLGRTDVLCTAFDPATGGVALGTFPVTVNDGPPVVSVPGNIAADATSALGATIGYAATATDAVSGPLPVTCAPVSGSTFPLGATAITCTAIDPGGHRGQASFTARVSAAWSNLLSPINPGGLSAFLRPLPVTVQFALTGASAAITALAPSLFIAPVDASGNVGAERPATALAPGVANLFRFVPLVGRYVLSMSTIGLGAGVWQLRVDLGDGQPHTARIKLL